MSNRYEKMIVDNFGIVPIQVNTALGVFSVYALNADMIKAFAELIIRECCTVADDHLDSEWPAGDIASHFEINLLEDND